MQKSTVWTIVIIVILVVLGVVLISILKQPPVSDKAVTGEDQAVVEQAVEELERAEAVVSGGSLVTEEGELITETGEAVSSEALPGSPTAPKQSRALQESEVPKSAIKLAMSSFGIDPSEFTVKAGDVVTLSVSSNDRRHMFVFEDTDLAGITVDVARNQTRAITFKAPVKGEYTFLCGVPGHSDKGEIGVMRVE